MNLWVKRTGQLFLAALFLMSCEDETYLLGFRDQNKKFNIGYREFVIGDVINGTVRADSVITDNLTGTQRLLVGEYSDPSIGTIRTEAFTEFLPVGTTKLAAVASRQYIYDSLVFQWRLDYYSYGLESEDILKLNIHRITEDTLSYRKPYTFNNDGKDTTILIFKRYLANSTIGYDLTPLGEATVVKQTVEDNKRVLVPTALKRARLEDGKDTLFVRSVFPTESAFGQELFNVALNDVNSEFSNSKKFRTRFKGFALIPKESNSVIGLSIGTTFSKVTLHYHSVDNNTQVNVDTLTRDFVFTGTSFHNITPTRSFGLPSADEPFTGVQTGDLGVVECGAALLTRIDLNPFYTEFADTIAADEKVVINSAELVVESVPSLNGYAPISHFELRIMKGDDSYADRRVDADSANLNGYNLITNNLGYFVGNDLAQSAASLTYNKTKQRYSGFPTLFVQNLFDNRSKEGDSRLRYLGIYPATSQTGISGIVAVGKSVNRTVFSRQNVKLRIYYTYPNKPNL